MHEELTRTVCHANQQLQTHNLVICSWGNVSGIDRSVGIVAIKPSGVAYDDLTPESMVLLDLDGNIVAGDMNPSSDTPTHLELYKLYKQLHDAFGLTDYAPALANVMKDLLNIKDNVNS